MIQSFATLRRSIIVRGRLISNNEYVGGPGGPGRGFGGPGGGFNGNRNSGKPLLLQKTKIVFTTIKH